MTRNRGVMSNSNERLKRSIVRILGETASGKNHSPQRLSRLRRMYLRCSKRALTRQQTGSRRFGLKANKESFVSFGVGNAHVSKRQ